MYQLYSLLLTIGFLVLLPRFLFDAINHGKYVAGFKERLGTLTPSSTTSPVLWLHCVSVGETQAARPLVKLLRQHYPHYEIVVSTITLTGQRLASEVFQDQVSRVFYFPFDWRWSVRRTLRSIKPAAVLLMETELWPNFLHECAKRNVPIALVNGRISDKSERRYRIVSSFLSKVVANLDLAIMQTAADGARLQKLGFPTERLFICGNMKFDAGGMLRANAITETFRRRFGLSRNLPVLLAASTHAPEERLLIECFKRLKQKHAGLRLLLAPRHPERFDEVAALVRAAGITCTRRSASESVADTDAGVILLDTIGELPGAYPLAQLVFVGGSIAPAGGHNILEPAAVGSCVITGPHTSNFHAIVNEFVAAEAVVQIPDLGESEMLSHLLNVLDQFLSAPEKCESLSSRAAILVRQNQGATERTIKTLGSILNGAYSASNTPSTGIESQ